MNCHNNRKIGVTKRERAEDSQREGEEPHIMYDLQQEQPIYGVHLNLGLSRTSWLIAERITELLNY